MLSVIKMRERCLPFRFLPLSSAFFLFLPLFFSSALPSGIFFFSDASLFVFVKVYYFLFSQLSIFTHNLPFLLIDLFLYFCLPFNSRETLLGAGLAPFSFRSENDFLSLSLSLFLLFILSCSSFGFSIHCTCMLYAPIPSFFCFCLYLFPPSPRSRCIIL